MDDPQNISIVESRTPEDRFREESFIRSGLLAETDLKTTFPALAKNLLISKSAKTLIELLAHSMFDNAKVLGRLNYRENLTVYIAVIKMRINMNTARAGVKPSDLRNQGFVDLLAQMINHYEIYLTRAADGWERGLQNEYTVKSETKQDIVQRGGPMPDEGDKGGLAGLFGGAFGK